MEKQGLLDVISWEEFKEQNRDSIKQEVDEDFFRLVANASGISEDKITIVAYEEPVFYDKEGFSLSATDITSIVMIILILALLLFVVLRSMGTQEEGSGGRAGTARGRDSPVYSARGYSGGY